MKNLKNKKGMTLVEVIIAFALLAIVVAAFVLIFSSTLVNILDFGSKSKTLAEANKALEAVYSIQDPDYALIDAELNSMNGAKVTDSAYLYIINDGYDFNYFIETTNNGVSNGFKVTIVGFYRGGEKFVDLLAFVRES
jgi:prepilin-type N-terminal cleavage/methylation domain-containing protein